MLTDIWLKNNKKLAGLPLNLEGLHQIQKTGIFGNVSTDPEEQQRSASQWETILDQRHPGWREVPGLEETKFMRAEESFMFNGRRVSLDFYKKLNLALEVWRTKPETVIEIGGGWGQVGRLLWILGRVDYINIDIPETLKWAKLFLDLESIPSTLLTDAEYKKASGKYDAFINSSSLGEMDNRVSREYLHWFNSDRISRCVLLNRFLNTYSPWSEITRHFSSAWYFCVDAKYEVERFEIEPDFTRIDGPEFSNHHREVFMVLKRGTPAPLADLDAIAQQSWYRYHKALPQHRTDNILWPDKKTLADLFEHTRRDATAQSLDLLITYLHSCHLKWPFEETHILHETFKRCTGKMHQTRQHLYPIFGHCLTNQFDEFAVTF